MSTGTLRSFQIDKLLETVVKERVSDLHITVGQPPVIRSGGRMVRLETRTLSADDTTSLMKSITPERNQQELQERGGTDFGFAFGDKARFRVACLPSFESSFSVPVDCSLSQVQPVPEKRPASRR
jgi:twitching motility protein PilT